MNLFYINYTIKHKLIIINKNMIITFALLRFLFQRIKFNTHPKKQRKDSNWSAIAILFWTYCRLEIKALNRVGQRHIRNKTKPKPTLSAQTETRTTQDKYWNTKTLKSHASGNANSNAYRIWNLHKRNANIRPVIVEYHSVHKKYCLKSQKILFCTPSGG